jgi:hypothetical protein
MSIHIKRTLHERVRVAEYISPPPPDGWMISNKLEGWMKGTQEGMKEGRMWERIEEEHSMGDRDRR